MLLNLIIICVLAIYTLALLFIFTFSVTQVILIIKYLQRNNCNKLIREKDDTYFPLVTVQLPIYNELYVVENLIDKVCEFKYPPQKLEIQVLDDSTDETYIIIKKKVYEWQNKGVNIIHLHRTQRKGYKAGALKEGLTMAKGQFIAIFDADFLPKKDFLTKTIPYFINAKVGMVQTRWGHTNRKYSLLTKLQAFGLNAHFTIEQVGRNCSNAFVNFNGTAGVWRKKCIVDAGNWQSDTLTEDLDLSYRAQLKNWDFVYLENVVSPAELPPVMSALKTQQYRWTKGSAETAKKHLCSVLSSKKNLIVKYHGVMHLLNSAIFLSVFISAMLSVPVIFIKIIAPEYKTFFLLPTLFTLNFFILFLMYFNANMSDYKNKTVAFFNILAMLPMFLAFSMGLSLHNSIAVIEGYLGKKTAFVRTPKFNLNFNQKFLKTNKYVKNTLNWKNFIEFALGFYFIYGVLIGIKLKEYNLIPYHILLSFGFFTIVYYTIVEKFNTKTN